MARCPADATRDDAVAIVTGGASGAGRVLALELASRGYAVVVVYLGDQGGAEAVVDEILAANGRALAVRADVADELDVERLFAETAAAFGGVDVVVHAEARACPRERRTMIDTPRTVPQDDEPSPDLTASVYSSGRPATQARANALAGGEGG